MTDDITPQFVIGALAKIVAANPADVIGALANPNDPRPITQRIAELPPEVKFAIAGIKFTPSGPQIQMHAKPQALELIGRALAMWTDKTVLEDARRPVPELRADMTTQELYEAYADLIGARH